jgi:hypothetical protein
MPRAQRGELCIIDLGMVQKPGPSLVLSFAFLDHERAVVTYGPRTTHPRQTRCDCPGPRCGGRGSGRTIPLKAFADQRRAAGARANKKP